MNRLFYFWLMDKNSIALFDASSGVCTDTRKVQPECLFVCIKGEHFNGNSFAKEALQLGAKHVIVDDPSYFDAALPMTLVENSTQFLQNLANQHRKRFSIPFIGITGSNGKTTTKELIYAVLSKKYTVLATIGNLNNHLGVPLTLLRLKDEHELAIIEMGANKYGDIAELAAIAEPNYGIITNIGKAHLEGFLDFDGVRKTKKELYDSISDHHGTIIVNADDPILMQILPNGIPFHSYGTGTHAEIHGELVGLTPFVELRYQHRSYSSPVLPTQLVGKYNFYNFLAAITFGIEFGVPYEDINEAICAYTPTNNRSQIKKTQHNTLILDCYNANPTSTQSALESFAMIEAKKKIVILGDMKELGKEAEIEHQKIISLMEKEQIHGYTVGTEYAKISSDAVIEKFSTTDELIDFIQKQPITEHLVLLKGSRSIGLEKVEEYL